MSAMSKLSNWNDGFRLRDICKYRYFPAILRRNRQDSKLSTISYMENEESGIDMILVSSYIIENRFKEYELYRPFCMSLKTNRYEDVDENMDFLYTYYEVIHNSTKLGLKANSRLIVGKNYVKY